MGSVVTFKNGRSLEITDKNILISKLQEYLFHVHLEEAVQLQAEDDLRGFQLQYVDISKVSSRIHSTVNFLLDCGFNLYSAIEQYIKGTLSEWLNQRMKVRIYIFSLKILFFPLDFFF